MIRIFFFSLWMLCGLIGPMRGAAQEPARPAFYVVVEGRFFAKTPLDKETAAVSQLVLLATANGSRAVAIYLPDGVTLSEEALRQELPIDEVPEGALLLKQYRDRRPKRPDAEAAVPRLAVGDPFPAFEASDIDGRRWTNDDLKEKVAIFNLWFTGCGPCRAEMPELATWKAEMPDVLFFSSTYETAEEARPVLRAQGFDWTALVENRPFADLVGSGGYPLTIIVERTGRIAMIEQGTSPAQRSALKAKLQSLR